MSYKITRDFRLHSLNQFIESIDEPANTVYYVFTSKHTSYDGGDGSVPNPEDTESYDVQIYNDMIFGKRVTNTDISVVIPRYEWTSGKRYAEYDDSDDSLFDKEFYTVVNATSNYHVYKCLYNNGNSASIVEPDFGAVDPEDEYYQTSDGYIWKYMYSVNNAIVQKFGTNSYFPVTSNTEVERNAIEGAIDIIKVEGTGNGYNNYVAGNNFFSTSSLRLGGNNVLYDISGNSSTSTTNGYYNGCYLYIKAGIGNEVGQFKKIVNYTVNSTSRTIQLESEFANTISVASVYEIYPGVVITSDGLQTTNVEARAIVNAAGNSIYRIDVLNKGEGYRNANAFVYTSNVLTPANAELRVIRSPYKGHGSNPAGELGATSVCISMTFANNEGNTIPQSNDYRTIGILKDPLFSNVNIERANSSGTFINGEIVYKINPIRLGVDLLTDESNSTISSTLGDFTNQFRSDDFIYITDGSSYMLGVVNNVINSTHLALTTNAAFTSSNSHYFIANTSAVGYVISSTSNNVLLSNVNGTFTTGDKMIGVDSGAFTYCNTTYISNVNKDFDTFINMYKYNGTIVSGEFDEDEVVFQSSITSSNAMLHSIIDSGGQATMYVTNKYGDFEINQNLFGAVSDAVMNITSEYEPEIVFKSGDILYIENLEPITRQSEQSETFKFIFEC